MTPVNDSLSNIPPSISDTNGALRHLPRNQYLNMLSIAIEKGEYRFAKEAALQWLAAFPGDLQAGLLYAQVWTGENRAKQALSILEELFRLDPEFLEAGRLLLAAYHISGLAPAPGVISDLFALGGNLSEEDVPAEWSQPLMLARHAIQGGDFAEAENHIHLALAGEPPTSLAAITHLKIMEASTHAPLEAKRHLAEHYHKNWPDCLTCTLLLADWLMQGGQPEQAVALLHEAAARDIGGQVAMRLWGANHPYRSLWPDQPEVILKISPPASVAAAMGWNQLAPGEKESGPDAGVVLLAGAAIGKITRPGSPKFPDEITQDQTVQPASQERRPPATRKTPESLRPIQEELERIGARLNRRGISRVDGRFPIYVIFSAYTSLESQYGSFGAAQIEEEMRHLAEAVQSRPGWSSLVFFADDPDCTAWYKIKPARPNDPWELKLALSDLDAALAKRGERIGAVLIVGGPEVVPFHHLPNPVDDDDLDVPSDNPYATRDENYFIPEWPVGRLSGGKNKDAAFLLASIQQVAEFHAAQNNQQSWFKRWWENFTSWVQHRGKNSRPSFGFTAAIWRQASISVYRPIGEPRSMLISPPIGVDGNSNSHRNGNCGMGLLPLARLAYFNLHGLADAAEWYGQRDPADDHQEGPDYPVALRPEDIGASNRQNNRCAPKIVFTEACYGGHIVGKTCDEALALKFLASGSLAVAGCTAMSYGSVSTPLIAADLLGQSFWNYVKDGLPAGEALRRAKIHLAREMHRRQGYLDGEDQKTLISFVLYGDPLAQPIRTERSPKNVVRPIKLPGNVKTICDRAIEPESAQAVPDDVLKYVKHVVSQYLPGMEDAQVSFSTERAECHAPGHTCPTSQIKSRPLTRQPDRHLVTLSKQVQREHHVHPHYARLTLDGQGKLVKLVISR
jgi:tetratricopeptide (TPR) repeat protein